MSRSMRSGGSIARIEDADGDQGPRGPDTSFLPSSTINHHFTYTFITISLLCFSLQVIVRDENGNQVDDNTLAARIVVTTALKQADRTTPLVFSAFPMAGYSGRYKVSYTPEQAGTGNLEIKVVKSPCNPLVIPL